MTLSCLEGRRLVAGGREYRVTAEVPWGSILGPVALTWVRDCIETSHHPELAPGRTRAVYLLGENRTKGINLVYVQLQMKNEAKYLEVVLDRGLTGSY